MKLRINEPLALSLCVLVVLIAQAADTTLPTTGTWTLNRWMAGSGKELENLTQVDTVPLESSKLRLSMQSDEPGDVLPFRE